MTENDEMEIVNITADEEEEAGNDENSQVVDINDASTSRGISDENNGEEDVEDGTESSRNIVEGVLEQS